MKQQNRIFVMLMLVISANCGGSETEKAISINNKENKLSGCNGMASSEIPGSGDYYLTTFGDSSDSGTMSCGSNTNGGSWYYAASRQRYGCGAHIKIEANGKCVIAQTDDYGPDVCVEDATDGLILDVSPLISEHLFGVSSAGWSDYMKVHVTKVSSSTSLGPCDGSSIDDGGNDDGEDEGNCSVHGDNKLYCSNSPGAALYSDLNTSSDVVNHLQTSVSWFKCWGKGELHAGGNTTWYYTQGDDNNEWGWIPAVQLSTAGSFDADPGAGGLPRCD